MRHLSDIPIDEFMEKLRKTGGNISRTAMALGVSRSKLYQHIKANKDWKEALIDERGSIVDECVVSARILARGIPEKDENGNVVGWAERPDGHMIRYLLSTLGRKEGFGKQDDEPIGEEAVDGFNIEVTFVEKEDLELQERVRKKEE